MSSIASLSRIFAALSIMLLLDAVGFAQDAPPQATFYDVQLVKEEIYKYEGLKIVGDYTTLQSPSGLIVLGKTEAGVTLFVIIGAGEASIEAPEPVREKFKAVLGQYPLKTPFSTVYVRISPKEYQEIFGKMSLTKSPDDAALAKAKELYDLKFLASYHAGPKAILPPYKTRVFELDTPEMGQISTEEGYWITLRRVSPYGSVYPARFVNPKQK
jgi:hypothetical protein